MKKSECFRLAQYAVLNDGRLSDTTKMEILLELEEKRNLAEYVENKTEKCGDTGKINIERCACESSNKAATSMNVEARNSNEEN